jgi:hypothetical protein
LKGAPLVQVEEDDDGRNGEDDDEEKVEELRDSLRSKQSREGFRDILTAASETAAGSLRN